MPAAILRNDERVALGLALAVHAGVAAALLLHVAAPPLAPPVRMSVTLTDDAAPVATAPKPAASAAADVAPAIGEAPVLPVPVRKPAPPKPAPKPVTKPAPEPVAKAKPAPVKPAPVKPAPLKAPAKPAPEKTTPKAKTAPADPVGSAIAASQASAPPAHKPKAPAGGSRIGANFLHGVTSANTPAKASTAPAAAVGPEVRAALAGAIARQLKPHWLAPQGADADQLVTVLAWSLNADGTLAAPPHVISQSGITESNRPQAARHAEQAIRAVTLAAPFDMPPEFYSAWKHVSAFRFDRKLSQ